MASTSTVLAAGAATVTATGFQTGALLDRLNALIVASNAGANVSVYNPAVRDAAGDVLLPSSTTPGLYAIPGGTSGSFSIQGTSAGVILAAGTTVTLLGGDSRTAVVSQGILNYSGNAGLVDALGSKSTINDTMDNAVIGIGGNNATATLGGVNQFLNLDSGTTGTFTQTGSGSFIQVGGAGAAPVPAAAASGAAVLQLNGGNAVTLGASSSSSELVLHGAANTITAVSGNNSVFAQAGGDTYFGNAASTYFVGATSVVAMSTVFGGSGNDTVLGATGVNYTEGSGNNVFASGLAPGNKLTALSSTITATTGHDILFGSTAGDQFNLGNGSELFVAGGGADAMFSGSVTPTVFGAANEKLHLIGTRGVFAVAFGNNDTIDSSWANQGSTFFAVDVAGIGNTTLIGSLAAPTKYVSDAFEVASVNGSVNTVHTITIDNFQTGDSFFLTGYGAADDATFQQAVNSDTRQGGGLSFTLSDNTTVRFANTHPTAVFDGGKDAL